MEGRDGDRNVVDGGGGKDDEVNEGRKKREWSGVEWSGRGERGGGG